MRAILLKRVFEVPEAWFAAFLFPFKLFTVCASGWLLTWYLMLPVNNTSGGRIDEAFFMATDDFRAIAFTASFLYFISTCVLVVGGCVQYLQVFTQGSVMEHCVWHPSICYWLCFGWSLPFVTEQI